MYNPQQYSNPYLQTAQNPYLSKPSYTIPNSNNIVWVQGIEGAKAYQIMPNSSVILLDSENDCTFYIKTSDNVGMCEMRTFTYKEVKTSKNSHQDIDLSKYVTKEELKATILDLLSERGNTNESTVQAVTPANQSSTGNFLSEFRNAGDIG